MYAAQLFNDREQNGIDIIYGAVTTGTNWKFLKLVERTVELTLTSILSAMWGTSWAFYEARSSHNTGVLRIYFLIFIW